MATIALVRHGTTDWNKEGRAQGSSDISLDQEGIHQALLLAHRISSEDWGHIYSSSLARAHQTAIILGNAIGLDIKFDNRLKERRGGQIEGTTENERINKWGENWRNLDLGIEPIEDVQKRGINFLEEINLKHKGEKILVVSHGALIQYSFNKLLPHIPIKHLGNTSITIIEKIDNQWSTELYNCTKHLLSTFKED
ncbi:histidine phosphatase family protein [Cohnella terricola]|uniref:Histidine phosphatase family protein n=1 Tax=Cohnella terricola TaxID=1289167 RepID=A0A559J8R5_9BACL|nr:histidine phosphatase family protein [Cohnella terricola]TVX96264.1 histidine phosphatase family protein [Cohnella terricola]